jgi:hypothetical protein
MVTGSEPCAAVAPRSSLAPVWKLAALPGRQGTWTVDWAAALAAARPAPIVNVATTRRA